LSGVYGRLKLITNKGYKMTYTRQHFEHVAKILSQFKDELPQTTYEEIVMEFGELFMAYNENFSDIRFQEACGINWRTFVRL
jgi:hypothetical protein